MYKTKKHTLLVLSDVLLVGLLVILSYTLVPVLSEKSQYSTFYTWLTVSILFCTLLVHSITIRTKIMEELEKRTLYSGETSFISNFIKRLKYCYSFEDLYEAVGECLEINADCSVLFINSEKNYVLYNSPNKITNDENVLLTLRMNFPASWKDGFYFIGDNYGIVTTAKKARGFFLVYDHYQMYVFCRYTKLFDPVIFERLYNEFIQFYSRVKTISDLSQISALSNEWQQLASTQKSYLPAKMPSVKHLKLGCYFRPLINVSGDYYTVLPIDEDKTLVMLGDVSGKGLAAALVMGLVMNTVKIMEDKTDLPAMIRAIDKAIKGMKLQDKYTVLFLGIVDTKKMTIKYVNASMSDPLIITRAPDGYRIKPLPSNCSLIGIIDLDDIVVAEQKLFRGDVIFMASDGVSEVMDETGVELGTTKLYENTIKNSASKLPQAFIKDLVDLIMNYNGNKKLRDDVTMLVAKIEG